MQKERNCEFCSKEFKVRDKRQVGRFCSQECNRKILRQNQLKKHGEYLSNETEEQKLEWLKGHYEKFVIKIENDCWGWNGTTSHGYANFNHRGKIMKAHRASWIIHNGQIPKSIFVLHKCDVRNCSNPDHLFLGNQTDNMKDMAFKLRTRVTCKLKESDVLEIKELLKLGVTSVKLAKKYNVSDVAIHNIKHGISWKHIV